MAWSAVEHGSLCHYDGRRDQPSPLYRRRLYLAGPCQVAETRRDGGFVPELNAFALREACPHGVTS